MELLADIEQFFTTYKNTAWAFFTSFGFLWIVTRLALSAYNAISNKAKLDQRQEFQAGYFDIQEARYDRLLDKYDDLLDKYYKVLLHLQKKKKP